ncbi:MAG: UDP-N-acetylglucosamine 1-carboxyvinyltransferase [Pirellulales bacterium]
MQRLKIHGGRPLLGSVVASGSKNAALPILAASILASEPVTVTRLPRLSDVATMLRLLRSLGVRVDSGTGVVSRSASAGSDKDSRRRTPVPFAPEMIPVPFSVSIDPRTLASAAPPQHFVRRMRASFCVLGPLLARRGRAAVALPGGCRIGPRPVDLHLRGLAALGAEIQVVDGLVIARANRLRGARVSLTGPHGSTVTGTANVLCAAVLARGTTVIEGAATEPEIVDLGGFLQSLGARIEGLGTATIAVCGVDQLSGGTHELIADRIEAATLLAAGLATGGQVTVECVVPEHLAAVLEVFADLGAAIEVADDRVTVERRGPLRPATLTALPYPGVPTDMQAQLTTLAALANGTSRIADAVFPERFHHVRQLRRMRADIDLSPAGAVVRGVGSLCGARVDAGD